MVSYPLLLHLIICFLMARLLGGPKNAITLLIPALLLFALYGDEANRGAMLFEFVAGTINVVLDAVGIWEGGEHK